ncbi:MAG: sugar ABC transporter permease [Armatimonadetes bacterium]|nr:sugar ABC transporter permease [Armatimonadota bacterium]
MQRPGLGLLFLTPAFVLVLGVVLVPLLLTLFLSFHDATVMGGGAISTKFVGFQNYAHFLFGKDAARFWQAVRTTGYFTTLSLALELLLGISAALILHREFVGRAWVRSLILLPWAVPTVVNARMWQWIFNGEKYGALNGLLMQAGILQSPVNWLSTQIPLEHVPIIGPLLSWVGGRQALHMIILGDTWKVTPLVALLTLAALQTIPTSLYEAAALDGAGPFSSFVHITLPLLRPVLLVILVLRTMELFRVFDIIYILMQFSINVLSIMTFEEGIKFLNLGRGAAMSFLIGLLILGLSLLYFRFMARDEEVHG